MKSIINKTKEQLGKLSLVAGGVICASSQAFAEGTGPDMTPLTDNISYATVITAVLAVTALSIGLKMAFSGGKHVKKAVD